MESFRSLLLHLIFSMVLAHLKSLLTFTCRLLPPLAGPGTSAFISVVFCWPWRCRSNRDISATKTSRGTFSRSRSSTTWRLQTATAARRKKPHETEDNRVQHYRSINLYRKTRRWAISNRPSSCLGYRNNGHDTKLKYCIIWIHRTEFWRPVLYLMRCFPTKLCLYEEVRLPGLKLQ